MTHNIKSLTGRRDLPARAEPYWSRLETGLFLGFRKLANGAGTWIVRYRQNDGSQKTHSLKDLSHFSEKTRYDRAVKEAVLWAKGVDHGVEEADVNVRGACERYIKFLRGKGRVETATAAEKTFKRLGPVDVSHW